MLAFWHKLCFNIALDCEMTEKEGKAVTKKQWGRVLVKTGVFLLIFALLFGLCKHLFVEKTAYGKYRAWKRAENVDILILGNSHADNGLRAQDMSAALSEQTGEDITVFNYAIAGMRMEQMYFFAEEIFKTHMPDLVVMETYAFVELLDENREVLARLAFDAYPLSVNKIRGVNYCVKEDQASYYLPIIKYHTRWKELTLSEMELLWDESRWPVYGSNGIASPGTLEDPGDGWFTQAVPEEEQALTPSEEECFQWFLALLEEKDIPLVLVSLPFKQQMGQDSLEQVKINNYLRNHYVDGDRVQLLDMNRMWAELDFSYDDLYDEGHSSVSGADKVTACLLDYLRARPELFVREGRE